MTSQYFCACFFFFLTYLFNSSAGLLVKALKCQDLVFLFFWFLFVLPFSFNEGKQGRACPTWSNPKKRRWSWLYLSQGQIKQNKALVVFWDIHQLWLDISSKYLVFQHWLGQKSLGSGSNTILLILNVLHLIPFFMNIQSLTWDEVRFFTSFT